MTQIIVKTTENIVKSMDTKGDPNSDDIKEMNWIKDGRHLGSEGM